MASRSYTNGLTRLASGADDFLTDTYVAILVNSGYVHDPDHATISVIVGSEIAVAGYARITISSKTVTRDQVSHRVVLDCDNLAYGNLAAGATLGGIIFAKNTGSDATSPLLAFLDPTDVATTGGSVNVTIPTTGLSYQQV